MKTLTKIIPFLVALASLPGCGSPGSNCTYEYSMRGVSAGNATLYDAAGHVVPSIDIQTSAITCPVVKVELEHLDSGVKLVAPSTTDCVSNVTGNETSKVTFDHKVKCGCDDSWDWTATNPDPPVKLRVHVRPVSSCGN